MTKNEITELKRLLTKAVNTLDNKNVWGKAAQKLEEAFNQVNIKDIRMCLEDCDENIKII